MEDTICAVSTAPGAGGIAVIRISGPEAIAICNTIFVPRTAGKGLLSQKAYTLRYGSIRRGEELIDEVLIALFRAPHSFTGEDTVEITCHGSVYIQQQIMQLLIERGCRSALPGEYTQRAFMNGKMDLSQAEAVADLIASTSAGQHRLALNQMRGGFSHELKNLREQLLHITSLMELELDFSDHEELEFADRSELSTLAAHIETVISRLANSFSVGNAIKNGIPVAIIGETNAGKSTLLNVLLNEDKAIVSDIHGTTRDVIEDTINIGGITFRFIDTAGLRETTDPIEALGIERSRQALNRAAIVISVVDSSQPHHSPIADIHTATPDIPTILLLNKSDLTDEASLSTSSVVADNVTVIPFSTKTGQGHQQLLSTLTTIADRLRGTTDEDTILVTNLRHAQALREAAASTAAILDGLRTNLPGDLIAQDLRATLHHLSSITGTLTTPDILASIFSRFCIGK